MRRVVNNRAGYIIEAIRENYQNERIQKEREKRAETARENELENLETEFNAKTRSYCSASRTRRTRG